VIALGERPSVAGGLGAALVLGGLALLAVRRRPRSARSEALGPTSGAFGPRAEPPGERAEAIALGSRAAVEANA
jgi:hypothetical protein